MSDITSECTAFRAYEFQGAKVYRVELDGSTCAYIIAESLPMARGLARKALREAYAAPYNQALIFRGHEEPGSVARTEFRAKLRTLCDEQYSAEWVD